MEDALAGRILGIDPGKKRVGLAISDPFGNFAVGLATISNYPGKDLVPEILAICTQYDVERVIMGLPLHMSGEEGPSAVDARAFAGLLESALPCPIELMDERLTSKLAEQSLRAMGIQSSRHRGKGIVDQAAAMRILQDYLDRRSRGYRTE